LVQIAQRGDDRLAGRGVRRPVYLPDTDDGAEGYQEFRAKASQPESAPAGRSLFWGFERATWSSRG
jgi:hypothetical protein